MPGVHNDRFGGIRRPSPGGSGGGCDENGGGSCSSKQTEDLPSGNGPSIAATANDYVNVADAPSICLQFVNVEPA